MKQTIAVLITIIVMSVLYEIAQDGFLKRTEQAGYLIIGKNTYRLVSLSNP